MVSINPSVALRPKRMLVPPNTQPRVLPPWGSVTAGDEGGYPHHRSAVPRPQGRNLTPGVQNFKKTTEQNSSGWRFVTIHAEIVRLIQYIQCALQPGLVGVFFVHKDAA